MDDKLILRVRDFWTAIVLICVSCFFLFQTTDIPFLNTKVAGVDAADWYNSAALVPYGIFGGLLLLSFSLLGIAIKDGGAKHALTKIGIGYSRAELVRVSCVSIIIFFYIFGLIPRADFILSSSLMITCLIWGFHSENRASMPLSTCAISIVSIYAMFMHFPRSEWAKPHDDDWLVLCMFGLITLTMIVVERRNGPLSKVVKLTPVISIIAPLVLVMAMAFGFRQNVPNRTGLIFSKIEYHYYVTIRPLWQGEK